MKKAIMAFAIIGLAVGIASCKKRDAGTCYCDYFSGDKKQFDLADLDRSEQIDSCYVLDNNANAFGGECELE